MLGLEEGLGVAPHSISFLSTHLEVLPSFLCSVFLPNRWGMCIGVGCWGRLLGQVGQDWLSFGCHGLIDAVMDWCPGLGWVHVLRAAFPAAAAVAAGFAQCQPACAHLSSIQRLTSYLFQIIKKNKNHKLDQTQAVHT